MNLKKNDDIILEQQAHIDRLSEVLCNVADNFNDMPFNEDWANKTSNVIADLVLESGYASYQLAALRAHDREVQAKAFEDAATKIWVEAMEKCKDARVNPSERNDLFFGISQLRLMAQEERSKP